jgi:hypothetical protein
MTEPSGPIFISYRRDEGHTLAFLVTAELERRGYAAYMDVEDGATGQLWKDTQSKIRSCQAFVLICTADSFVPGSIPEDPAGPDWVLLEVSEAIASGRRIVPVLANNFLATADLPGPVKTALLNTGVSLETQFPSAVFDQLAELISPAPRAPDVRAGEARATAERREPPGQSSPRHWRAMVIASAIALVIIGGIFVIVRERPGGPGRPPVERPEPSLFKSASAKNGDTITNGRRCDFNLRPFVKSQVSPGTRQLVIADINGDGKGDLVLSSPEGVSVARGNGDGTFAQRKPYTTGPVNSLVVADLNLDGRPDIAAAGNEKLVVLLGGADGSFGQARMYPAVRQPFSVAVGGLHQGGGPDLVVASLLNDDASVLINQRGTLGPPRSYPLGGAADLVIADFDNNGKADVAAANQISETVTVRLGNGAGALGQPHSVLTGEAPTALVAADLDGDGALDLAVASQNSSRVDILFGDGDGSFPRKASLNTRGKPTSVSVSDLDGDGKLDLTLALSTTDRVGVFLGKGHGEFEPERTFPIDTISGTFAIFVATADLNGDGIRDVAVAQSPVNSVSILLGSCRRGDEP